MWHGFDTAMELATPVWEYRMTFWVIKAVKKISRTIQGSVYLFLKKQLHFDRINRIIRIVRSRLVLDFFWKAVSNRSCKSCLISVEAVYSLQPGHGGISSRQDTHFTIVSIYKSAFLLKVEKTKQLCGGPHKRGKLFSCLQVYVIVSHQRWYNLSEIRRAAALSAYL